MFYQTSPSRVTILVIGAAFICSSTSARESANFQTYQIGRNAFVSDRNGIAYLVFRNALYRSINDESDNWDQVTNNIRAVTADPAADNILYAITTDNQIAKSLDKGKKWITLSRLPGNPTPSLWCLYVNPVNPQELSVGTSAGLIRSSDAGFTWHPTSLAGTVFQIVINPRAPEFQFAIEAGGIFVSRDGGTNWKKSEAGLPMEVVRGQGRTASAVPVKPSALIPVNAESFFLLVTTQGKGVFRSDDNGLSWKSSSTGLPSTETFYTGFAGPDRIVLVSQLSIYSSTEGTHWQSLPMKGASKGIIISGFMKHPKRDGLLLQFNFLTDDVQKVTRLGYLDSAGVLVGLNYGVLPHSDIDSVWVGAVNERPAIFAVSANLNFTDQAEQDTRPTFLSVSLDGGYSWDLLGKPTCGKRALVRRSAPARMINYGSTACVQESTDRGASWQKLPGFNFGSINGEMTKIEPDPKDSNILYYSVGVNERRIFRYQYDPATKQGQSLDLKVMGSDVIVAEDNNKEIFTGAGQISTDGGWTWADKSSSLTRFVPGLQSGYKQPLTFLSFRGSELRALYGRFESLSSKATVGVIKSSDLGNTWQAIKSFPDHKLIDVFINPNNPANVLFSTVVFEKGNFDNVPGMVKVLETKDGGETWSEVYSRRPTNVPNTFDATTGDLQGRLVRTLFQMPKEGGRSLLIGGSDGLWKSDDEGRTWKRLGGVQ